LIEVPINVTDFQKDADAVQIRFERVDGARRRILASVKKIGNIYAAVVGQKKNIL
jgi:hypothetical protein